MPLKAEMEESMAKIKIHELAKELEVQSKTILSFLQEKGIEAKAAQSSVDEAAAQLVRGAFAKKEKAAGQKEESAQKNSPVKENPVKQSPVQESKPAKADAAQESKPAKADTAQESKPAKADIAQESKPAKADTAQEAKHARTDAPQAEAKGAEADAPKKKKTIIFVSNPQNSKMTGQRQNQGGNNRSQGGGGRPQNGHGSGKNNKTQERRMPIKPLTPPSPTPAVQMVSSKPPQHKPRPEQQAEKTGAVQAAAREPEKVQAQGQRSQQPYSQGERPQNTGSGQDRGARENRFNDNRGENRGDNRGEHRGEGRGENRGDSRGRDNRGQGGRQERGQFQNRGGGANGSGRPSGDRQNGFQRAGRPGGEGGQGDRRMPGAGQGRNRGFNGAPRDNSGFNRGNGGQGAGFRDKNQSKSFGADAAPAKDIEKKREEDKRRANSQEKDKRSRKDHIYEEDETLKNKPGRFIKPEKKKDEAVEEVIKVITLPDMITIKDLADKMKLQPSAIVKKLFLEGKIVTVNQEISYEDAEGIAMEYDILCEREVKVDVIEELLKEDDEEESTLVERPPVICVMGHVDHGKTSLLDAMRKTIVTDREAGGITQHIGAYTVTVGGRKITFLDTPGHEAFTAMRMRGANSTDIAILVVAADDGVMPQTVEAISHAKAAGIEIIVAVNKIDKPSANIDRVNQELTEYELIATDWGGSTEFVPVSAKSGEGIENLLETILLTADILELKANPDRRARGLVIEAELDKGRGPVATVLVQKGTLHVGDFISAGACYGKVRAMVDDKGKRVKEATPSMPVEILGLSDVPSAGEVFISHENDKTARTYAETYLAQNKERKLEETKAKMSLDDLFSQIQEGSLKELNLIVKADVQGSVEAVKQSLMKLSNEEVVVKCIHGGVGAINESDVTLASASNAIIIGFNVRPDVTAKATAEREGVDVRLYKVIYQAIEDVEAAMKGMLDPVFEEKVIGHAEVRQIFKASQIGNIAGSYVMDGIFQRGCKVRITREGAQIYEGALASLKRFKDDVKEVKEGYECGLVFEGFDQIQELDMIEAYIMVEVPR